MQSRCSPLTSLINTGCFHFSHHSVQTLEAFVLGGNPRKSAFSEISMWNWISVSCIVLLPCKWLIEELHEWPVVPIKVVYRECECVLIVELCARAQNKPWLVINASHISHLVLVCEAVGSTWEMFNGFGFLEKKKTLLKKTKGVFWDWPDTARRAS